MKVYGMKKATEFTAKQISVIYGKAKNGMLKVEKWFISELYNLADYYGYDDNCNVERDEAKVLSILDAVFANDMERAQELINNMTDSMYEAFGKKTQAQCNRSVFVA